MVRVGASKEIGKGPLGFAEISHANPEHDHKDRPAGDETRQIELGLAPQKAPTEAVDDPHRRVETVDEPPFLRNGGAGEAHRRGIEAKLQDEGNDVSEVPVFDVQSGEEQRRAQARQHRH